MLRWPHAGMHLGAILWGADLVLVKQWVRSPTHFADEPPVTELQSSSCLFLALLIGVVTVDVSRVIGDMKDDKMPQLVL
jgi:hypothetical protein